MQVPNAAPLQLHLLLTPGTVQLELRAQTRDEVLRELVQLVPGFEQEPDRRETLFQALREREELHSTGVGDGVALPHARQALPELLKQPVLVFGRHRSGVSFRAVDGRPVHLFFLLLAPDLTVHLAMLARLSRLLRQTGLRERLLNAASKDTVIELIREAEHRLDHARGASGTS
ncbi:MAG: PTS sugar transporter subunit IIA [Verrucomicrobiota bacterium]|nr:PTS sugar transporter subunit IIA [Limisphaera sp.]MDW8381942.1 PTS sugar transporter subunit IIA [Verrucomicrobiota bacterium]